MAYDGGHPGRLRQLERMLAPSGLAVIYIGPDATEAEVTERLALVEELKRKGREHVLIQIDLQRAPGCTTPPAPSVPYSKVSENGVA